MVDARSSQASSAAKRAMHPAWRQPDAQRVRCTHGAQPETVCNNTTRRHADAHGVAVQTRTVQATRALLGQMCALSMVSDYAHASVSTLAESYARMCYLGHERNAHGEAC
eukprot:369532-Rhodomonas_salina.1